MSTKPSDHHECRDWIYVDQSDESETVIRCRVCGRVIHRQPME